MKLPRVMIAAPKSGSGKTILTCGLLKLLKDRGTEVSSFKCGPDYIDPMFHRAVIGVPGSNLDTFFSSDEEIRSILTSSGCEAAVLEGVMGIYDGITGSDGRGSCYDVAKVTDTPVILVIEVKGMGQTMLSLIRGILADDRYCLIKGIVLNRISKHYFSVMEPQITALLEEISGDRGSSIRLLGGIPDTDGIKLESRHLGLLLPEEIADLKERTNAAAGLIKTNLDMDAIEGIMELSDELPENTVGSEIDVAETLEIKSAVNETLIEESPDVKAPANDTSAEDNCDNGPVLAVARDEAFCFYYEENLRLLRAYGIRIKEFSPLHDSAIPEEADGLLLGGGYPELHADELSRNTSMMESIRNAIDSGMPSLAECGGFMTLMSELTDNTGKSYKMAGVLDGKTWYTGKLGRFGYVTVTGSEGSGSMLDGLSVRGHEFHYYDSSDNGNDASAVKPGSGRAWKCINAGADHIWGYPHLYYPSCPELIQRFRTAMETWAKTGNRETSDEETRRRQGDGSMSPEPGTENLHWSPSSPSQVSISPVFSYKYFENRECKYYPCHDGIENMNCLFCYCPLYHLENCPGDPSYIERNGRRIKVCTACTFPHKADNYDAVIEMIRNNKQGV